MMIAPPEPDLAIVYPEKAVLTWSQPDPEHLVIEGTFRGGELHVQLKKLDESQQQPLSRGFNWIQEYPFNR